MFFMGVSCLLRVGMVANFKEFTSIYITISSLCEIIVFQYPIGQVGDFI